MQRAPLAAAEEAGSTPRWVHDAVFYQIFPDRFARSLAVPKPSNLEPWNSPPTIHGFKGGDLLGIVEHLDYLQDLGISAIYLNPIFQSASNHRYHTHDYYTVDPILGGNAALRSLLLEAHQRNVRIILDGVFNHASRSFYQFSSILESGPQSPYIDWFTVYDWPLHPYPTAGERPGYEAWWGLPALPKFATATPAVREFLWGVGQYWIEQGIDGWRLDVPNEINDDEFWREFRRRVKGAHADAYIVGEIWEDARRWLAGDQFDGVMNYVFTRACLSFFAAGTGEMDEHAVQGTGLFPIPPFDAQAFGAAIEHLLGQYPWPATLAQLNLLDSHDTARFLTIAGGDDSAFRLATLFQMTFPGAPCVYYGDEIGMQGGPDPGSRSAFPWNPSLWNDDLRSYVKRCIALRHQHPVLRRGGYRTLYADGGVYVFARMLGSEVAIIALNAARDARTVTVDLSGVGAVTGLASVWDGSVPWVVGTAIRDWQLPSRSGRVLAGTLTSV
jgi:neopullulanase